MKKALFVLVALAMCLTAVSAQAEMKSKFNVDFYGYVKLDAFYQHGLGTVGNYLVYAPPSNLCTSAVCNDGEIRNADRDVFGMTARQSRFGFLITGPETEGGLITRARIEGDFYGTLVARAQDVEENKGNFQLRRAYVEIIGKNWEILAGDEWMIMSPIFPMTNNYTYAAEIGNSGYRTPQIRLTTYALDKKLIFQVAATNKMGDADYLDMDTGRMAGVPTWEAGLTFKDPKFTLGFTGHYGLEELKTVRNTKMGYYGSEIETWSGNVHSIIPLGEVASISGEWYMGANLDGWYTAGQGNGWVITKDGDREALESTGGWVQLMVAPAKMIKIYATYGIDDANDDQLKKGIIEPGYQTSTLLAPSTSKPGNVAITKNQYFAGMVDYNINASTKVSLEYMQVITDYDLADENGPAGYITRQWDPGKVDRYTLSFWYMF